MIRLGLTGSIAMGKSTTAAMFAAAGAYVYDADAAVHALYAAGGQGAPALAHLFPEAVRDNAVDRTVLSTLLKADPSRLLVLEGVVHPLLTQRRDEMLATAAASGANVAVLDIPLLFETGADAAVDAVVVVTAPPAVQRARVMARPGMDARTFDVLSSRQLTDADKRARADFLVQTGEGLASARGQVDAILATVLHRDWRSPRAARP